LLTYKKLSDVELTASTTAQICLYPQPNLHKKKRQHHWPMLSFPQTRMTLTFNYC